MLFRTSTMTNAHPNVLTTAPSVVLIIRDTAESRAAYAIYQELAKTSNTCVFVPVGVAAKKFVQQALDANRIQPSEVRWLSQLCGTQITGNPEQFGGSHNKQIGLSKQAIAAVINKLDPKVVFSGVVSKAQTQLMAAFKRQGAKVMAYNDCIAWYPNFLPTFEACRSSCDEYWVTIEPLKQRLQTELKQDTQSPTIRVTGHPATEIFNLQLNRLLSSPTERARILKTLNIEHETRDIICYVGTYGPPGGQYEQDFKMFVNAVKQLNNVLVLLAPHPGAARPLMEAKYIKGCDNIKIVPSASKLATSEIMAVADTVCGMRSTMLFQAALGRANNPKLPRVFFVNSTMRPQQPIFQQGLACLVSSETALRQQYSLFTPTVNKDTPFVKQSAVKMSQLLTGYACNKPLQKLTPK